MFESALRDRADDTAQIVLASLSAELPPLLRLSYMSEAIVCGPRHQSIRAAWVGPRF